MALFFFSFSSFTFWNLLEPLGPGGWLSNWFRGRFFFALEVCKTTRREDIGSKGGRRWLLSSQGPAKPHNGMLHILNRARFLQQTLLLEQLLLAATGTGARVSCLAAEQAAVRNCHGGISTSAQEGWARVGGSTPLPLVCHSVTTSSSRRHSPRSLHQLSLEVFLWEGRVEVLPLRLAFLRLASFSRQGCDCSLANWHSYQGAKCFWNKYLLSSTKGL